MISISTFHSKGCRFESTHQSHCEQNSHLTQFKYFPMTYRTHLTQRAYTVSEIATRHNLNTSQWPIRPISHSEPAYSPWNQGTFEMEKIHFVFLTPKKEAPFFLIFSSLSSVYNRESKGHGNLHDGDFFNLSKECVKMMILQKHLC